MAKAPKALPYQAWNPVTGCTRLSPGCDNCYAERISLRLQAQGVKKYQHGFAPTLHPALLKQPLTWRPSRLIFVNSMSDLFHPAVTVEFLQQVFETMQQAWWHEFMIITKRPGRAAALGDALPWPENLWLGATVENADYAFRVDHLKKTAAKVKFISMTPLLGPPPVLDLSGIHWVSVGHETGQHARPMNPAWEAEAARMCALAGVPCFYFSDDPDQEDSAPAITRHRLNMLDRVRNRRGKGVDQMALPLENPGLSSPAPPSDTFFRLG